jgi:shikimate dehydrogenase
MKSTKHFAVFGNPILHSKSPHLFNSVFEQFGIDAQYTRIHPKSAIDIINIIKQLPLSGANITAPFKEEMIDLVDVLTVDAESIGAINTIVNNNGRLLGYNTDHFGVTQSLKEVGIELHNCNCLVLGGGGAARSAVYGLKRFGANVYICNRTKSKAETIANDFECKMLEWDNFDTSLDFDVVISTLLPIAVPSFLKDIKFAYLFDASYKQSAVKTIAQSMGVKLIAGERWLLHQAVEAFRLYIGDNPPIETMNAAISRSLQKDNLRIATIDLNSSNENNIDKSDLVVSAEKLNEKQIKSIIDEEISKAFGG